MASNYWLPLTLIVSYISFHCVLAAVAGHGHSIDNNIERESDGSFRGRDAGHYNNAEHNVEFDHEAILGSVKEAEEFDRLSPEAAKERLSQILILMDLNGDRFIDRKELHKWIMNSFVSLAKEEAEERLKEADDNRDGMVTRQEYLQELYGADNELDVADDDMGDHGLLFKDEKQMWAVADVDGDGVLNSEEFAVFSNPEEHEVMHGFLVNQTLREKDANNDGEIDFNEFVGERGVQQSKDFLLSEKDRFDNDLDTNKDGVLSLEEIHRWIIPQNDEIADEEVDHLFVAADDNHDDLLSFEEILLHSDAFVGSDQSGYSSDLLGDHFDDEL